MQKNKIKIKHRIEYALLITFLKVLKISPKSLIKLNQRLIQFILMKIGGKPSGTLLKNLKGAFPNYSTEEIDELAKLIIQHFARILIEIFTIFAKKQPDKILKAVDIRNFSFLEKALKREKGVILFSAHFGNWELIPLILSRKLKQNIHSIARRMNNPLVEEKVRQFREFMGSEIIDKKNSIRTIIKRLEKNEILLMLIDQNTIKREAVFVDFFGQKASAVTSVSQLHIKRDIPIVPVFLHYEAEKIILEFMEEIKLSETNVTKEESQKLKRNVEVVQLTQKCASIIEEKIRQYPEQWFWFHNRWKTRPGKVK